MHLYHFLMGLALSACLAFAAPAFAADAQPAPIWVNSIGMEFTLIPAGSFLMGSPEGEGNDDERPQHRVNITRPFYLGTYEVTQGQWERVMGDHPSLLKQFFSHRPASSRHAVASCERRTVECEDGVVGNIPIEETYLFRPVENVTWNEVQEFVRRLNEREPAKRYRLPTEAEWEYACRAGVAAPWSFGDDLRLLLEHAWIGGNSAVNPGNKAGLVGQKLPNSWGLYDMHGNVWEWVQDRYDPAYYGRSPENDPPGPEHGALRVMRGGSAFYYDEGTRSAFRLYDAPDKPSRLVGFRLARDIVSEPLADE